MREGNYPGGIDQRGTEGQVRCAGPGGLCHGHRDNVIQPSHSYCLLHFRVKKPRLRNVKYNRFKVTQLPGSSSWTM